jgi:dTDP-4-amino-4,6-dideoxygalactose transaminase
LRKPDIVEDILLTKPFVPPLNEFLPYLDRIWESRRLTNGGAFHEEFEQALCDYLGVKHICLCANGTLALMIALKTLKLKGEVITTPFTSPATIQAIYWNDLKPVFVDINETDLNIDSSVIESAVTLQTAAILPVHIFGTPCDVDIINRIAVKNNLKVVYDAAHCFGVEINGNSICNFGDLSILSFHATKIFNTFEGGAIVCHDPDTKKYIDSLKNTGLDPDHKLIGYGVNAKMNEIQSAFGLCQLKYVDEIIVKRKAATLKYQELLKEIKGLRMPTECVGIKHNYSYFPIIIDPVEFGAHRDELYDHLKKSNIITRKYFYPLVSDYSEFKIFKKSELPVAEKIAKNILCIPLFHDITDEQIQCVVYSIYSLHMKHIRNVKLVRN